uniref:Uncharacterized protein n=1 Tax=Oryzias sinensis TaxID=183150 RepID=A0A8C7WP24_9TELE
TINLKLIVISILLTFVPPVREIPQEHVIFSTEWLTSQLMKKNEDSSERGFYFVFCWTPILLKIIFTGIGR